MILLRLVFVVVLVCDGVVGQDDDMECARNLDLVDPCAEITTEGTACETNENNCFIFMIKRPPPENPITPFNECSGTRLQNTK